MALELKITKTEITDAEGKKTFSKTHELKEIVLDKTIKPNFEN